MDPIEVPPSALQGRGQAGFSHQQDPLSCPQAPSAPSPTNEAGLSGVSRIRPPEFSLLNPGWKSGPRLHIMTAGLGLRGPSAALPQRNALVCSTPALPHPLGSSSPPPALTDTDGAPTSSLYGSGRNPSLASSGPAPAGPELHRAWGPGGLRKRKWRSWDVGRAGRPEKPYSVPPPGPCAHQGHQSATIPRAQARSLNHTSALSQADFPFAEGASH